MQLKQKLAVGWEKSIFRRSLLLQGLLSVGFLFNFGTLYAASRLMDKASFGIFYFAYTIVVVLASLAPMVNLYLSANIAEVAERDGVPAAWARSWVQLKQVFLLGLGLSCVAIVILVALGAVLDIKAYHLVVLAVLIAFANYLTEIGRVVLQGLRRTLSLGIFGLAWMAVRFALVTTIIFLTKSISAALVGMLLSGPLVFLPVLARILRSRHHLPAAVDAPLSPLKTGQVGDFISFGSAFGLFVLLSYLDIGLAYLKFDAEVLGRYSASSVIPKGILTFALPVLQVVLPVMVTGRVNNLVTGRTVAKGIGATLLVAGSVSLVGYVGQPVLCGGVGIVGCDTGLMNMMLIAILPLCFLRFAVTAQLAMGLRNQGVILAVLVAVTATVLFYQAETPSELAAGYTVSVTAIMTAYVILGLLPRQLVSRFRAR